MTQDHHRIAPDLGPQVRAVLGAAAQVYSDERPVAQALQRHLERLDEPLRVAIAGKMKAGKSTLLNAIVGEQVAPTDAGECTKVVTWYEYGNASRVQLIDTPGIDSLSSSISARSTAYLTPKDEAPEADAVVYLLRHLHSTDVHFLESFRDRATGRSTLINTVGVLSRADEIGAGRLDALVAAQRVAKRYREDPSLRQLCQTVIPVAGLLAHTGRTLRPNEFAALAQLAAAPREVLDAMLLSVDRFTAADRPVPTSAQDRRLLLDRLGVFGIRLSISMIRAGARDVGTLAAELVGRSGLDDLRRLLAVQFTQRRDILKARSALLAVDRILREQPRPGTAPIAESIERILAGAHEFRELKLLGALRGPGVALPPAAVGEAERLLGGHGTASELRLGLGADEPVTAVRSAANDALRQWRERAENPLTDRITSNACRVVTRSCEGVLAGLVS